MDKHSFALGYSQVRRKDSATIRKEIMALLKITARQSWHNRLTGRIIPNVEEKEGIEKIFAQYGVKKSQVWGKKEQS
jgi:hypothetical protein